MSMASAPPARPAPILCPNCGTPQPVDPQKVAERLAVDGAVFAAKLDVSLDIQSLERKVKALQRELDEARTTLADERREHSEIYRRMHAENEGLKLTLQAAYTRVREGFTETASEHKAALLEAVRNGKLCANAAAPPDEVRAEAAAKIDEKEEIQ